MKRLAFLLLLLATAPMASAESRLRCESNDGRWTACAIPAGSEVRLVRQLSRAGCWEGDTWGHDRNRLWVTNGCRAEFSIDGRDHGHSGGGGELAGALILGAIAGAIIANAHDDDHSRPNCGPHGCNDWGMPERRFTCESRGGEFTWCDTRIRRGEDVEVARQLSHSPCQWGRSWGVDRGRVWVNRGCRAEFLVH